MTTVRIDTSALASIAAALRQWWEEEAGDWDELVDGRGDDAQSETDLWDDLPQVDSKAIARTSPIFERHLGVPLDVKLIRRGGYGSIEEVILDLVPKMGEAAAKVSQGEPEK
jgi:hypothetical protein